MPQNNAVANKVKCKIKSRITLFLCYTDNQVSEFMHSMVKQRHSACYVRKIFQVCWVRTLADWIQYLQNPKWRYMMQEERIVSPCAHKASVIIMGVAYFDCVLTLLNLVLLDLSRHTQNRKYPKLVKNRMCKRIPSLHGS